jgi:hypothetical protein
MPPIETVAVGLAALVALVLLVRLVARPARRAAPDSDEPAEQPASPQPPEQEPTIAAEAKGPIAGAPQVAEEPGPAVERIEPLAVERLAFPEPPGPEPQQDDTNKGQEKALEDKEARAKVDERETVRPPPASVADIPGAVPTPVPPSPVSPSPAATAPAPPPALQPKPAPRFEPAPRPARARRPEPEPPPAPPLELDLDLAPQPGPVTRAAAAPAPAFKPAPPPKPQPVAKAVPGPAPAAKPVPTFAPAPLVAAATAARPAADSPSAALEAGDPQHKSARKLARLLVSEIKLYNEKLVADGLAASDLYGHLKEPIDQSFALFEKRIPEAVRASFDYVTDELVRQLAGGDASKLGPGYHGGRRS